MEVTLIRVIIEEREKSN